MNAADLGPRVEGWTPPPRPGSEPMQGRYALLERLGSEHVDALFAANRQDDRIWDYLPYGPFAARDDYAAWVGAHADRDEPVFWAIKDLDRDAWAGVASYLRINPEAGSIEVGHINYAPGLQRRRAATEAMYLMMRWAFAAGYRRYEWKCNALNLRSRRAAQRLGLSFEGVFRQAAVIKGHSRDTAWFAAIDAEWPALSDAFEAWLDPANFDAAHEQRRPLSELTRPILFAADPSIGA